MTQNSRWLIIAVVVIVLIALAGLYVWQSRPAPVELPAPTATVAPTSVPTDTPEPVAQAESPLAQPESPLDQPESPLTTLDGREIVANPAIPIDRSALVNLVAATSAPEPLEGMGSISAVLYTHNLNQPVFGTVAYLTPADIVDGTPVPPSIYVGPQPENGDVNGQSNAQGQFFLDNVPPGDYYLIVWTIYDWPAAFISPDDSLPVRITVEEGDRLDLGLLYVDWP